MESIVNVITEVNSVLNSFAWGPVMLALLIGTGVFLTFRTGWIQVRWFGYAMKNTVGSLFKKKAKESGENLSAFQAVCTAMAGTVGLLKDPLPFLYAARCYIQLGEKENAVGALKGLIALADEGNPAHVQCREKAAALLALLEK